MDPSLTPHQFSRPDATSTCPTRGRDGVPLLWGRPAPAAVAAADAGELRFQESGEAELTWSRPGLAPEREERVLHGYTDLSEALYDLEERIGHTT